MELNIFRLADYQIPYGYAPVLVAEAHTIRSATRASLRCGNPNPLRRCIVQC